MSELVVGIVLALLAGTLLPFATSQAGAFIESRRDLNKRRRELYERALRTRWEEPDMIADEPANERKAKMNAHLSERNAAVEALRSSFALFDDDVVKATKYWGSHVSTPEDRDIMRLWANGNRWTARARARRLLRKNPNIIAPRDSE